MSENVVDIDTRKRRAFYRANHRGIKEMDILLGKYAEEKLPGMSAEDLDLFESFLNIGDRDLEGWIMRNEYEQGGEFESLVDSVRVFHNLR